MYTIYDTVTEVFNRPFTEINDASATRAFTNSIEEAKNKNEYELYHIGAYNDNNGQLEGNLHPVKIKTGFEVKKAKSITPEMQKADLAKHEKIKQA